MSEKKLNNCTTCGGEPSYSSERENHGQSGTSRKYYVYCSCGMRTMGYSNYMESEEECKGKALKIWNRTYKENDK